MKQTPDVSIVIPVYNTERYLARCVDSVLAQTLPSVEIILVDDGGSDGSVGMCDTYAASHPNKIRVIHKENGGLTSAWKAGSAIATGKYLGYVDSDDFIEPEMYERLFRRAEEEQADVACCGLHHIYEDGDHKEWDDQMEFPTDVFTPSDLEKTVYPVLINDGSFMGRHLHPNRVTKLVRTDLVKENLSLMNDAVSIGEDFQFSLCMFLDAKKVVILKDYFPYHYYMNTASMTMQYDPRYMEKIKILKQNLSRISESKNGYDFDTQITNDFLCLTVLHIKGGIYKKKSAPYREHKQDMHDICTDPEVARALRSYRMPRLTPAEKLFLFFMKHHMYLAIFLAVRIYFR
ncbi:MAG: glycosyltransferase [Lachnospiraceae bacterium]|nr:glycosyltransferase [Lachnospiraceae bacterium]